MTKDAEACEYGILNAIFCVDGSCETDCAKYNETFIVSTIKEFTADGECSPLLEACGMF
jgi:hypothetical protein